MIHSNLGVDVHVKNAVWSCSIQLNIFTKWVCLLACIFACLFKYFGGAYNCSCSHHLDRCHVLYAVCTRLVQNAAAWLVTGTEAGHITGWLVSLRWLPDRLEIDSTTFIAQFQGLEPHCLWILNWFIDMLCDHWSLLHLDSIMKSLYAEQSEDWWGAAW